VTSLTTRINAHPADITLPDAVDHNLAAPNADPADGLIDVGLVEVTNLVNADAAPSSDAPDVPPANSPSTDGVD